MRIDEEEERKKERRKKKKKKEKKKKKKKKKTLYRITYSTPLSSFVIIPFFEYLLLSSTICVFKLIPVLFICYKK